MEKEIYKSKTMWIGAFGILYAVYSVAMTGNVDPHEVFQFLTAAGFITIRDGMK